MDGVSIGRFGGVEILVTPAAGVGLALLWIALDSLFVFTIGVLIPLGFTDMSTILRWRGR